jgi:hypothetical protein
MADAFPRVLSDGESRYMMLNLMDNPDAAMR